MKKNYLIASALISSSLFLSLGTKASEEEKCYGIAAAGKNECAYTDAQGNQHSCMGSSQINCDPRAWCLTPKGQCEETIAGEDIDGKPVMGSVTPREADPPKICKAKK